MLLIIGLGNPGEKYVDTRHNIGFAVLDKLKTEWDFPDFEFNKKFNAEISVKDYELPASTRVSSSTRGGQTTNYKLILVKPQTFMNLSGLAVKAILDFYKLTSADILVIHDDKDIALGKYKIADDSSSAGHNGVQNIIDTLGTQNFKRIRIGIGAETDIPAESFVLQNFSEEEKEEIERVIDEVIKEIATSLRA